MRSAIILSLILAVTTPAQAQTNCQAQEEQIAACEAVLEKADSLIRLQSDQIDILNKDKIVLEEHLDYLTAELAKEKSWYNNTTYTAPLALIIGIVLGVQASK